MTLLVDHAPAAAASRPAGRRRLSPRRRLAAAGIAVIAVVVASAGVYALLSATAFNATPQDVGSGTLKLALADAGAGFSTPIANLAPGDVVKRHVTLTNGGTLDGDDLTLLAADASPTVLTTDAARGLQVVVNRCPTPWDTATGTCSVPPTPLGSAPLANITATPLTLVPGAVASTEVLHLQLAITLPDSTEVTQNGVVPSTSVQGRSAALTWTFTVGQRTATDTSS